MSHFWLLPLRQHLFHARLAKYFARNRAPACTCSFCAKQAAFGPLCPTGSLMVERQGSHARIKIRVRTKTAEFHVCTVVAWCRW